MAASDIQHFELADFDGEVFGQLEIELVRSESGAEPEAVKWTIAETSENPI